MSNFAKRIASSNARFVFFLVLIVLFSGALRLQYVLKNPTIVHDEAISYLAATGNQAAFQEVFDQKTFPYGEWASTADWQKFLQPRGHLIFKKIQTDLGIYDVHPPLYFWLLHLWVLVVGVHNWAGESLNILLGVINIVLVSFGARSLLKESWSDELHHFGA